MPDKIYESKPENTEGFKEPVSWLGGRELVASLKGMMIYSLYGENTDPRSWMEPNIFPCEFKNADEINAYWTEECERQRIWKKDHFEKWGKYFDEADNLPEKNKDEFWFDYIADSGDGQMGVYGVGCLCFSDLWLTGTEEKVGEDVSFSMPASGEKTLLPRGSFLFIGGDTAYHVASYSSLHERFQTPFRWAFASVRKFMVEHYILKGMERNFIKEEVIEPIGQESIDSSGISTWLFNKDWDGMLCNNKLQEPISYRDTEPVRPLFGVPANHDYYDGLGGFNRQFRRPPFKDINESRRDTAADNLPLKIPTFKREQEASYTLLRLPFGWHFLGIDSENEKLDFRQRVFFQQFLEENKPNKLIISTPEPTTVFGRKCDEKDKTAIYIADITQPLGLEQPFLKDGKILKKDGDSSAAPDKFCRLDLSGDVHHYARYWGPDDRKLGDNFSSENYASLVAGGGGAFYDPTETLIGKTKDSSGRTVRGEIPPQKRFPNDEESRERVSNRIFDLTNIKKGGYVQTIGAAIAGLIFFAATFSISIPVFFTTLAEKKFNGEIISHLASAFSKDNYHLFLYGSPEMQQGGLDSPTGVRAGFILLFALIFLGTAIFYLHSLIDQLKVKKVSDKKEAGIVRLGSIRELWMTILSFLSAAAVYFGFLCYLLSNIGGKESAILLWMSFVFLIVNSLSIYLLNYQIQTPRFGIRIAESTFVLSLVLIAVYTFFANRLSSVSIISDINSLERLLSFGLSILLILHFVGVLMLVALSIEYTNWLPQRFKHLRSSGEEDYWLSLLPFIGEPIYNRFAGIMNESSDGIIKKIWSNLKKNSVEYYPVWILNACAIALLVASFYLFGKRPLVDIGTDALFILVVAGGFIGLVLFAISTGGAYHRSWQSWIVFGLIGFWHALLQLFTPLLIVKSKSWLVVVIVLLLSVLTNGFSGTAWLVQFLFGKNRFHRLLSFRLGAKAMQTQNAAFLSLCWFVLGAFVLSLPFIVIYLLIPILSPGDWVDYFNLNKSAGEIIAKGIKDFGFLKNSEWLAPAIGLLIAIVLGYRMSRIWLSWYLAVSLAFNGHNNEAGGAARIEGFKHILRIKLERDKLTVYVIGFENAETEMANLKPTLVDKFELRFQ